MMTPWILFPGYGPQVLGYVPGFLSEWDPRPARDQINARYRSGWLPTPGTRFDPDRFTLHYPGDPPFKPMAMTTLHDTETIILVEHEFLVILQRDGSHEAARVD